MISRAFASLTDMLSCCHHLVDKNEGHFYALKGKEPNEELMNLSKKRVTVLSINKLSVPELAEERHLIILQLQA
ncbi:putative S-adenosylmethionine-dependent methyltransferase involved in bacterial cell division [Candidatus Regiella insecticola 5.15]|uniref:Putative S-adenosylmethionine-dependent methyltransferase involved in bacterial cell division n=1 Tax=Candidatus Regiella insecticola 5.15 TaxID=1005043 RepID=G2GZC1_9ENTR|nr:putative S-adenosylmethionine-dependent methyltransferase involved in bacterial cell division [Candidatus Regiella insecticola 5.15]